MPIREIPTFDEKDLVFTLDQSDIDFGLLSNLLGLKPTEKEAAPKLSDSFRDGWNAAIEHIFQTPERVIFNGPATVVYWEDGTKTVVRCQSGDAFVPETGVMAAMLKKLCGNTGKYNSLLKAMLAIAEYQMPPAALPSPAETEADLPAPSEDEPCSNS